VAAKRRAGTGRPERQQAVWQVGAALIIWQQLRELKVALNIDLKRKVSAFYQFLERQRPRNHLVRTASGEPHTDRACQDQVVMRETEQNTKGAFVSDSAKEDQRPEEEHSQIPQPATLRLAYEIV
jgi:hypothetical protein